MAEDGPSSEVWSEEESVKFELVDTLKDSFEENNPLSGEASAYSDLLSAALSEVNWSEVAEAILEE